ncbi:aromatic acid exporter family protein [Clostridium sp. DJ247]|uniref:aromatic acid exporter family protein n=1 Tax=Clostridium sp. DJ247 TaxID=2726188 RepID=UPI0016234EB9|nr:aromatic acid exporter family protein [Clostridium sp. DJ247]MBC2581488.1 aromatic acid exporter family protein [Clostridium sp. DJ247]
MKFIGYRTIKTGIGACAAMIIAKNIGLQYAAAAGVITILSIQATKKQSFKIALQRVGSCVLALFISTIIFRILGYSAVTFGIFLFIFIPLTVKFNFEQGIVVSSVLVTHMLVEKSTNIFWLVNELSLMLVGVGVALLLNLYMPSIETQIKQDQIYIEEKMKEILLYMADALRNNSVSIKEEKMFNEFEERLKMGREHAYNNLNNYFLLDASYYVKYMEMRLHQLESIKRMRQHFKKFFMTYEHTIMVASFTEKVANSIYEENTAQSLIDDLDVLRGDFKKMSLPTTREEFENRAMLFQFLNDIEQILIIKREFKQSFKHSFVLKHK